MILKLIVDDGIYTLSIEMKIRANWKKVSCVERLTIFQKVTSFDCIFTALAEISMIRICFFNVDFWLSCYQCLFRWLKAAERKHSVLMTTTLFLSVIIDAMVTANCPLKSRNIWWNDCNKNGDIARHWFCVAFIGWVQKTVRKYINFTLIPFEWR